MSKLWTLLALAGLLALCGCPKPAAQKAAQGDGTQVVVTDSTAPADEVNAGVEAGDAGESDEDTKTTSDGYRRPTKEELQGKWFALYGGKGLASKTFTYENGHTLEFLSSGIALWTVTGNGGSGLQLASNWEHSGGEITLTVDKPGELSTPAIEVTPLAFGRDDEVGLTSGGRDRIDAAPVTFRYKPRLAGSYLALEGHNGELMVYGRAESGAPDSAPNLSGRWKLTSEAGTTEAEVTSSDGRLQVTWGSPLQTKFTGTYTNGYFVGNVTSSAGSALAALIPSAGGLDGVISTEPYSEMETTFELTRDG